MRRLAVAVSLIVLFIATFLDPQFSRIQGVDSGMPRGPGGAPPSMRDRDGMEDSSKMKEEVMATPTNSANLEKRLRFVRVWLMDVIRTANVDDVVRSIPRGTIEQIERNASSDPVRAAKDLDNVFESLKKLDSGARSGDNYRASMDRPAQPPGMEGQGARRTPSPGAPGRPSPRDGGSVSEDQSVSSMTIDFVNPASNARLWGSVSYPKNLKPGKKYPAVVVVPGALTFGSMYSGTPEPSMFVKEGFVVGYFDPDGRGNSEGNENYGGRIHQDGLNAFLKKVAGLDFVDRSNVGVVSFSAGIIMSTGALVRHPGDPAVKYYIDVEGPSDRNYMLLLNKPDLKDERLGAYVTRDEAFWAEREAVRWASKLTMPYLRIQNNIDHVHGSKKGHALDMIRAATARSHGGEGASRWTRLNGPENEPNSVWSEAVPPKWRAGGGMPGVRDVMPFVKEMAGLSASAGVYQNNSGAAKNATGELNLFYVIHVHGPEDGRQEFAEMTRAEFEGVTKTVKRIAATLEKHGAKGTFEFLQWYADAALKYQGAGKNAITELEGRGHEIAVHAHSFQFDQWRKSRASLFKAGAKSVTTLGGRGPVDSAAEIGYTALTDNYAPLDFRVPEPIKNCGDWGHGGNAYYSKTWNFIHPWRPGYDINDFCSNNPRGGIVYIDHVSGNWLLNEGYESKEAVETRFEMGPLSDWHFGKLKPLFKNALKAESAGQIKAWGFVSHEVEYQGGHNPHRGTEPVNEQSIGALDEFLTFLDGNRSSFKWLTVREIAERYREWERR